MTSTLKPMVWMGLSVLALSGCSLLNPQAAPDHSLPQAWYGQSALPGAVNQISAEAFFAGFGSPEMTDLIETALRVNTDLLKAAATLEVMKARRRGTEWSLVPSANVSAQRTQTRKQHTSEHRYEGSVGALWTFNFAGRDISRAAAARADENSARLMLESVKSDIAAQTALAYIALVRQNERISALEEDLSRLKQTDQIAQWRYRAGLIDFTDTVQAASRYQKAQAQLLEAQHNKTERLLQLSELTQKPLHELSSLKADVMPVPRAHLVASVPADLINQRADVAASREKLAAAHERVNASMADFAPTLKLTGNLGTAATGLSALGTSASSLSGFVAALSMPILNWGEQTAMLKEKQAQRVQAELDYRQTLLRALRETEAALSLVASSQAQREPLTQSWRNAQRAQAVSLWRYQAGLIDYSALAQSQSAAHEAHLVLIDNRCHGTQGAIELFRALGSGWRTDTATK